MTPTEFQAIQPGQLIKVGNQKFQVTERICCPIAVDGYWFWARSLDGKMVRALWPSDAWLVTAVL